MREKSIFKIVLKVGFKIRPGHWGIIAIIFPCLSKNNLFSNMQFIFTISMQLYTYGEHLISCFCKCFWILNHFCLISIQIYLFLLLFLQASICRSSQPLSGFSARCLEDEQMLQAIRKANPGSDFLYVVDTRPKVSILPFLPVKRLNLG